MQLLRQIPPIHELLKDERIQASFQNGQISYEQTKKLIHEGIEQIREQILNNNQAHSFTRDEIRNQIVETTILLVAQYKMYNLQPVINGTGTILHTNLGRARIAPKAVKRVVDMAKSYSTLEYDLHTGRRGSRQDLIESYITELTGAEAAIVVNNNAAAVYMVLSAFTQNTETIVSRGELVEIGGSFRVSSIMEESGTKLKEVGTTNKTHLFDYEQAINENTKMIMKVHTSNFYISGFTSSVERNALAHLAQQNNLIYYEDLGSGLLYDLQQTGISDEPVVRTVLDEGAGLVSFSVDKLLGGPQAGIIAGKKKYIDQLKKHQLARVLRVDKMTYAALEETLRLTRMGEVDEIPTLHDLLKSQKQIIEDVQSLLESSRNVQNLKIEQCETESKVGGGTLPEVKLKSYGIKVSSRLLTARSLSELFRKHIKPIIVRIEQGKVLVDFRTVQTEEQEEILKAIKAIDTQLK
ncbi:L-seryl-tRNA(Sec) selenium transferase [Alkalibacillus silvisoli]|uniref:L-seryl-tRNA(Sec) selenium transferase n=1 Tax=Alkalibacillus silvisoli TaxID=392823 RepID=A0ABN0ZXB9_9BACI